MRGIHKSKQYDIIDMFYDTYRYIFTLDNREL